MAVRIMNLITQMGMILMVLMVIISLMMTTVMTTVQNNSDDSGEHANISDADGGY
jgi:hypothetical protein